MAAAYADYRCVIVLGGAYYVGRAAMSDVTYSRIIVVFLLLSLLFCSIHPDVGKAVTIVAKYPVAVLSAVVAVYIAAGRGWYLSIVLALLLGTYLAIHSFYRQNFLIMAFAFMIVPTIPLVGLQRSKYRMYMESIGLAVASFLLLALLPTIAARVMLYFRSDESRYVQSVAKTQDLVAFLSGNGAANVGDRVRLEYISFITDHWLYFLLPGGFGQKVLSLQWRSFWMPRNEVMLGSSLDGGHLFLAAHFGILLAGCILFLLGRQWVASFRAAGFARAPALLLLTGASLTFFATSSPFSQMSFAISFGLSVGCLLGYAAPERRIAAGSMAGRRARVSRTRLGSAVARQPVRAKDSA
jgi:hypothetical protein